MRLSKKIYIGGIFLFPLFWGIGCKKEEKPTAKALLLPKSGSNVRGEVYFYEKKDGVEIKLKVKNLAPNSKHGFHIHEKGDCSAEDATSAGGHWNPSNEEHPKHLGDLGNIQADEKGEVNTKIFTNRFFITKDPSPLGLAVIIHEKEDDLKTPPAGAAGKRIACGVIGKMY